MQGFDSANPIPIIIGVAGGDPIPIGNRADRCAFTIGEAGQGGTTGFDVCYSVHRIHIVGNFGSVRVRDPNHVSSRVVGVSERVLHTGYGPRLARLPVSRVIVEDG